MSQNPINVGAAPDDGTGDTIRASFIKVNSNTSELYNRLIVDPTAAPTSTDDTYEVGTNWIKKDTGQTYKCLDNTASAAVWKEYAKDLPTILAVDTIDEFTVDAGVSIEGVVVKDSLVDGRDIAVDGGKLDTLTVPANEVVVNSVSDLPAPLGGKHTLADFTNYKLSGDINLGTNYIEMGVNCSVFSTNVFSPLVTYTGTGSCWKGVDKNATLTQVSTLAPNGELYNFSSPTTVGGNIVLIDTCFSPACAKFGTFDNLNALLMTSSSTIAGDEGITIAGDNWDVISLIRCSQITTNPSFKGIDLGSSLHRTLEFTDLIVTGPSGVTGISGLPSSGNIRVGELASISNSTFSPLITPLSGLDPSDIRISFKGNSGVSDSISDALLHFNGNALVSTINTVNVPVKVNAVWSISRMSRFSASTNGRVTYLAERADTFPVDISAGITVVGGGTKDVSVHLAKNGSVIADAVFTVEASGSKPRTLFIPWQVTLELNDYLEVFVSNNSDTTNLVVPSCVVRIR